MNDIHPNVLEWHKDSHPLTKNEDGTPKVFYHGTLADSFDTFQGDWLGIHVGTHHNQANNRLGDLNARRLGNGPRGHVYPVHVKATNLLRLPDLGYWRPDDVIDALGDHDKNIKDKATDLSAELRARQFEVIDKHFDVRPGIDHSQPFGVLKPGKLRQDFLDEFRQLENEHFEAKQQLVRDSLSAIGYDGIVYRNEHEGTVMRRNFESENKRKVSGKSAGDSIIVFHPHQIKSVFNQNPTDHPNILLAEYAVNPDYDAHFGPEWPQSHADVRGATRSKNSRSSANTSYFFEHQGKNWFGKDVETESAHNELNSAKVAHAMGLGDMIIPTQVHFHPNPDAAYASEDYYPHHVVMPKFGPHQTTLAAHVSKFPTSTFRPGEKISREFQDFFDRPNMIHDRVKLALFDYLTQQSDRHDANVGYDKKSDRLFMIDNEQSGIAHRLHNGDWLDDGTRGDVYDHQDRWDALTGPFSSHRFEAFNRRTGLFPLGHPLSNHIVDPQWLDHLENNRDVIHTELVNGKFVHPDHNHLDAIIAAHQKAKKNGEQLRLHELLQALAPQSYQGGYKTPDFSVLSQVSLSLFDRPAHLAVGEMLHPSDPHFEKHFVGTGYHPDTWGRTFDDWASHDQMMEWAKDPDYSKVYTDTLTANHNRFVMHPGRPGRGYLIKTHGPGSQGAHAEEFTSRLAHAVGMGDLVPPSRTHTDPHGTTVSHTLLVPGRFPRHHWDQGTLVSDRDVLRTSVFDYLLANGDRHASNVLEQHVNAFLAKPWLIDHSHIGLAPPFLTITQGPSIFRGGHTLKGVDDMAMSDLITHQQLYAAEKLTPQISQFNKFPELTAHLYRQRLNTMHEALMRNASVHDWYHAAYNQSSRYEDYATNAHRFLSKGIQPPDVFNLW